MLNTIYGYDWNRIILITKEIKIQENKEVTNIFDEQFYHL